MDIATQAILGAAVGQAVLGRKIGNRAMLYGAVAGILPDLDVIVVPFLSQIDRLSAHRGLSHSIFFLVAIAFILAWLFRRLRKNTEITFQRWLSFFLLTLLTHAILDSFTGYGTQLFLPFSNIRVSLASIPIVDPVYTMPLLAGLIACFFTSKNSKPRRIWNYAGLIISTTYLIFTLFHKEQIEKVLSRTSKTRK